MCREESLSSPEPSHRSGVNRSRVHHTTLHLFHSFFVISRLLRPTAEVIHCSDYPNLSARIFFLGLLALSALVFAPFLYSCLGWLVECPKGPELLSA